MNTKSIIKKTPHSKSTDTDVYGNMIIKKKLVWCFENDNHNARLVKRWVYLSEIYVKEYKQGEYDNDMTRDDMRNYHVDVWSQKVKNYKMFGLFKTNYELKELQNRSTIDIFLEV